MNQSFANTIDHPAPGNPFTPNFCLRFHRYAKIASQHRAQGGPSICYLKGSAYQNKKQNPVEKTGPYLYETMFRVASTISPTPSATAKAQN